MTKPKPPRAHKRPKILRHHDTKRSDPWFWLREKDNPDVISYLMAENAYTDAVMKTTSSLQQALYEEMRARIKEDDSTVPEKEGAYSYYRRYVAGGQYPIFCRMRQNGSEEIALDANELAQGRPYLRLGVCHNSPDHRYLAYSLDLDGSEEFTLQIKDLTTGVSLEERIPKTYDSLEWANDSHTFFYTKLDRYHRPRQVYRHRLGDDPSTDALIFEEQDPRFFVSLSKSESNRFIYIASEGNNMSEWRYLDANDPNGVVLLIEPRSEEHEYDVTDNGDQFFIRTNVASAKDFKIVRTPITGPSASNWQDFIGHEPGRLITDLIAFRTYLVVSESSRAIPRIRVIHLPSGDNHYIEFGEGAYEIEARAGREFDATTLRFIYTSLAMPEQTYDYHMATRTRELLKQQTVLGGFDTSNYLSKRVYAKSSDGVEIPISLFYHKSVSLNGTAPLLLYGYGSYGNSIPPRFGHTRLSYVDRGFVYAIAHIRGGMEMGYQWYEDGKLLKKKNTFNDYIVCAEYLIEKKFTAKGQILAVGGSAGGMLMGTIANTRPDLFKAIIAHVPFVDVINTMLDDTLPLTTLEYNEWGNPNDEEYFNYMLSYSPYDNVKSHDYPHMLIISGMNDPRVTYWEPAKWTAKLRDTKTDDNLLLLKTHMDFGHGGASGRFDHLKEAALDVTFALKAFGHT
ncbi:MAG: S9 family peptidase [Acidiferrobacterales bacterium]